MFKVMFLLSADADDPFKCKGPEAASLAQTLFAGLAGYYQSRSMTTQIGDVQPVYSGVAEFWFQTPDAAVAAGLVDISSLLRVNVSVRSVVVGMERVVLRTPDYLVVPRVKGVFPFARKPGMSVADFQHHWWHRHGPIAALTENATAYIQVHPLPAEYAGRTPQFDGITEISWRSTPAALSAMASRQMSEDQSTDAGNFVDRDTVALFLVEQEVVVAP